jgi:hypothetical protein
MSNVSAFSICKKVSHLQFDDNSPRHLPFSRGYLQSAVQLIPVRGWLTQYSNTLF